MNVRTVGTAFPSHYYDQETLLSAFRGHWRQRHHNLDRLEKLHRNVLVGGRNLALAIEEYDRLETWGQANDAWIRVGLEVGEAAVRDALDRAGIPAAEVDALYFTSITGVATPSLDARLMNRLPFRADLKRVPIFGLGCAGGAAGLARAADYLRGFPGHVAILLAVELCSLTVQKEDLSIPNLIATGLFGDGAAAVLLEGADRRAPGPRVVESRSSFFPDTERVMGWDISEDGFRLVLSSSVPEVVLEHLRRVTDYFLAEHGMVRGDVAHWICHPGGPKVLQATAQALEIPDAALEASWRSLREVGNLSSVSVLLILRDTLDRVRPRPGDRGVLLALGPAFAAELVLLEW